MTYTLQIGFSPGDLSVIRLAGLRVTIVFGVTAVVTSAEKSVSSLPTIVWLAFDPFQNNVVSFSDSEFSLYASRALPAAGDVLQMATSATAIEAMVLPFESNGEFGPPHRAGLDPNYFGIDNLYQSPNGYMVFGLTMPANVNGDAVPTTPVNARVTPYQFQCQFSPSYSVQVFLQTGTENAMLLPNAIDAVQSFALSAARPTLSLMYNAKSASFQLGS